MHQKHRVRYETRMQTSLEELRNRSSRGLFVYELQFQKEFEIYLCLWKEVLALGRSASQFREILTGADSTPSDDLEKLRTTHDGLRDRVYDNRPFYAPDVYDMAKELLKKARKVLSHQDERRRTNNREKTEELLDEISRMIDRLCDAIRERIWSGNHDRSVG